MKKETKIWIAVLISVILIYNTIIFYLIFLKPDFKIEESFRVIRIIDGDTIKIGTGESVRLICVNAPEFGEVGFSEATLYLEDLILNKRVKLVRDVSDKDKYGRLLRYVYLNDLFVNEDLVEKGFASAYEFEPDTTLCPEILEAEKEAKLNGEGIWS